MREFLLIYFLHLVLSHKASLPNTTVMINDEAALLEEDRGGGTATCDCDDEEHLDPGA